MSITLEPTLAPNEFRVVEWGITFEIMGKPPLSLEDAKAAIIIQAERTAFTERANSICVSVANYFIKSVS